MAGNPRQTGTLRLSDISRLASRTIRRRGGIGLDKQGFTPSIGPLQVQATQAMKETHQTIGKIFAGKGGNEKDRFKLRVAPRGRTLQVRCVSSRSFEVARADSATDTQAKRFRHGKTADVLAFVGADGSPRWVEIARTSPIYLYRVDWSPVVGIYVEASPMGRFRKSMANSHEKRDVYSEMHRSTSS